MIRCIGWKLPTSYRVKSVRTGNTKPPHAPFACHLWGDDFLFQFRAPVRVGSPEWHVLTQRRAELIHKMHREGLTPAEVAGYRQLHRTSLKAVSAAFPPTISKLILPPRKD